MESWSLAGQTALVTGGTRGIGRAIAEELARHGASVYICARSEADVQERVRAWKEEGLSNMHGCACDLTSPNACAELISHVSNHFSGKLNILVNNAAILLLSPVVDLGLNEFSSLLSTNLEAPFNLCRLAHPLLKASGQGTIVFISSIAGSIALSGRITAYSMTKGALNQLTRSLAFEWAGDNIRVNAVAPGYTSTDMLSIFPLEAKQEVARRVPLQQRFAKPSEISPVVAFLCMPCSFYITGSIIPVDGGFSMHNSA